MSHLRKFNNSETRRNAAQANKQAHIVRWLRTLLSLYRLSYIFSSNSGVIGSFFLVGTANLLFAPSKIFFTKKDSVGEITLTIECAHRILLKLD